MKRTIILIAAALITTSTTLTAFAAAKTDRDHIKYAQPSDPENRAIYKFLTERRTLEKLQVFLSPVRLPNTLKISLEECDDGD